MEEPECISRLLYGNGSSSGSYALDTYQDALGVGSDGTTPNVIPNDTGSLLLTKCQSVHEGCALSALFQSWIENGAPQ